MTTMEIAACEKLQVALSDYQAVGQQLLNYRAQEAKAELAMSEALEDGELSEEEAAQRISQARDLKAVYAGRAAKLERKLAGLLGELKGVFVSASAELTHLIMVELEKWRELVVERVQEALGGVDEQVAGSRQQLLSVTRFSKPLNALERLKPSPVMGIKEMSGEDVVRQVEGVLKALEGFKQKLKEGI